MPVRKANAVWEGDLKGGQGNVTLGSGAFEGRYSFGSRFEEAGGTNPEELIGAAHAGCFSMALTAGLGRAGHSPKRVATSAKVHLEKVGEGFQITRIELDSEAEVPGIDEAAFQERGKGGQGRLPRLQGPGRHRDHPERPPRRLSGSRIILSNAGGRPAPGRIYYKLAIFTLTSLRRALTLLPAYNPRSPEKKEVPPWLGIRRPTTNPRIPSRHRCPAPR